MPEKTLQLFDTNNKPSLEGVGAYLSERTGDTEAGVEISRDSMGNRVYKSRGKKEATLFGDKESMLVVSYEGCNIIRQNKGILHRLASPDPSFQRIGGNTEGQVYKVALNTIKGVEYFAVKYYFPIERRDGYIFTPGIDQMRLMQLAEREQPLEGLQYATPIMSTIDMTVSPYVEDGLDLMDLEYALYSIDPEVKEKAQSKLSDEAVSLLSKMKRYDDSQEKPYNKILPQLNFMLFNVTTGLNDWIQQPKLPFETISDTISAEEPENPHNYIISIPEMWTVFEQCQNDDEILHPEHYDRSKLLAIIRRYCHLVEITVGSKEKLSPAE